MSRTAALRQEAADPRGDDLSSARLAFIDWLMARSCGEPSDARLLACVIAARCGEPGGRLPALLGLEGNELTRLFQTFFPGATVESLPQASLAMTDGSSEGMSHAEREEAADVRALLLEHRANGAAIEGWIAAIVARTVLRPNHLWEDFGVANRGEISAMMARHFPALAERNAGARMRWKKFLYKQLCQRAEINLCRAPNCQSCDEYAVCFSSDQLQNDRAGGVVWNSGLGQ